MAHLTATTTIDASELTTREINRTLRRLAEEGVAAVTVKHPAARHNLAVALNGPLDVTFEGSVSNFCGAMGMDDLRIKILGNTGWSCGADLMSGHVRVEGNAGGSTAASARGGTIVVGGNAGARAGIAMKGATVLIGGSVGYMTGFQMQHGTIVVCGDAGEGFGDSMYQGTLYCGGTIAGLGADTQVSDPSEDELSWLKQTLSEEGLDHDRPWQKVTSAGKLWRFDKNDFETWKQAL